MVLCLINNNLEATPVSDVASSAAETIASELKVHASANVVYLCKHLLPCKQIFGLNDMTVLFIANV